MADRPQRSLPASLQRHGGVLERVRDIESSMGRNGARNVDLQPVSEIADEMGSNVSEKSMSMEEIDEDDLLDDEEEYQKEMEDQRILDSKNGHFEEELSPVETSVTAEEAAEYLALSHAAFPLCQGEDVMMTERECSSIAKSFSAASMSLNTYVGEEESSRVGKEHSHASPGTGGDALLIGGSALLIGGVSGAASVASEQEKHLGEEPCLKQVQVHGNLGKGGVASSIHAGDDSVSEMMEQPVVEKGMATVSSMHACMGGRYTLNAKSYSSSLGSTENQSPMPIFSETDMRLTARHGHVIGVVNGEDHALLAPTENRSLDRLPAAFAEESQLFDLMETRSLVVQSPKTGLVDGPPNFSDGAALVQVNPLLGHSFNSSPSPINPQPNPFPNIPQPTSQPINHQPKNLSISNLPKPKNKHLKPKQAAHFKNNCNIPLPISSQSPSAAGKEVAVAIFTGRQHPKQSKISPSTHPQPIKNFVSSNMTDFPPIMGTNLTPAAPAAAVSNRTTLPAAAPIIQQPKPSSHPYQTRSQKAKNLQLQHKFKVSKPPARHSVNPASTSKIKAKNSSLGASSQPASVKAGRELTASLFTGSSELQPAQKTPTMQPSFSAQKSARMQPSSSAQKIQIRHPIAPDFDAENMSDFPLLEQTGLIHTGVTGGSAMQNNSAAAPSSSLQPENVNNPWRNLKAKGPNMDANISTQNAQPEKSNEGQPNVQFRRSMADVLRSGQPAEGPILLDPEKADKRGEVRIVEGKPCLFFSADETSLLAGRLGPAIVGKFSHSIPPAHQIQKALGNLKLVGAMSWNFLNAKHIFIQLSDMRDYVKLLNGPNNSPVWYVDHHPMRLFKWTPDFDPFFEIPIVAIWCNILALPVHLFEESSLIAIGEMLGKPVQVDRATISRSRVSFARICIEVDLSRPISEEIDIDIAGKRVTLKVKWDKIPLYCSECKHVGHSATTCYASGRRPMPPKRDYSQRPNPQSRPPPNREGEPHTTEASRQPQAPQPQPFARQATVRPPPQVGQPMRQERRNHGVVIRDTAPGPVIHPGPSPAAAEGSQAAGNDGFIFPKKKKKANTAARRARRRERSREKSRAKATSAKAVSDGEGYQGMEGDDSSSEMERGSRSRSPSITRGFGYGPLAMVLHGDNMFGALEDFPSDDAEVEMDSDDHQDHMILELPNTRLESSDPVLQYIGYTSPPAEGSSKKARLSASGAY